MRYSWNTIEREQVNPTFLRQAVHTERLTIARLELAKGGIVPLHHHENEQVTMVQSGRIRFDFPDESLELGAGDVLVIAPNRPHGVEVLEDCVAVDLFAPIRADWIAGTDAYLRQK